MRTQLKTAMTGNNKYWVVLHKLSLGSTPYYQVEAHSQSLTSLEAPESRTFSAMKVAEEFFEKVMEANKAPKPELIKSELTPNKRLNVQMYRLNGRYTVSTSSTKGFCIQMRHFDTMGDANAFWCGVMFKNGPARQDAPKPEPLLARIDTLEKRVKELEARLCGTVVMVDRSGKPTGSWVKKLFK